MKLLQAESGSARCVRLVLAVLAIWLLLVVPAGYLFGREGIQAASVSAVVCVIPGCLVFWMVSGTAAAAAQVRAVLVGTGLRILFGLGGAGLMHEGLGLSLRNYLSWLAVFYLSALFVETVLLMPSRSDVSRVLPSGVATRSAGVQSPGV